MNNFMMSDMLRICDEFGAWLIESNGKNIFPQKGYKVSCVFPDLSEIKSDKWYEQFYTFCAQNPEVADEVPADDCIVNMIVRCVFMYWQVGEKTFQAIGRLRESLEKEGRLAG